MMKNLIKFSVFQWFVIVNLAKSSYPDDAGAPTALGCAATGAGVWAAAGAGAGAARAAGGAAALAGGGDDLAIELDK